MTAHDPNAFDPLILDVLHVPSQRLLTICRQLAPAWQRRVTIPVLETVLVDSGPTGTIFRLNNLDLQVTVTADDLTCSKPFTTCIPFGLLRRFAASFDGVIRLTYLPGREVKDGVVQMPRLTLATDDGCSATINALIPAEEFPTWISAEADQSNHWRPMICTPAELRRMVDLACWCKPGTPCHADVLLSLANPETAP